MLGTNLSIKVPLSIISGVKMYYNQSTGSAIFEGNLNVKATEKKCKLDVAKLKTYNRSQCYWPNSFAPICPKSGTQLNGPTIESGCLSRRKRERSYRRENCQKGILSIGKFPPVEFPAMFF